jgi:hypothetical protein
MTTDSNKPGPTTLWKTLKGRDVKTNDGKDLGEIKDISDNYIHVEKGTIHKESFWIPKYIADAFDGKILWLLLDEEKLREKYQYGKEAPQGDQYAKTLKVSREHHMDRKEAMEQILTKIYVLLKTIKILEI